MHLANEDEFDPFCLSSYLAFRYVARPNAAFSAGWQPRWPDHADDEMIPVATADETRNALQRLVDDSLSGDQSGQSQIGLLLSGGIDSAILAALVPKGTPTYTIRFVVDGPEQSNVIDESGPAAVYAKHLGMKHTVVDVRWQDYLESAPVLMAHKLAPLHAVEVGLYCAARQARSDGVTSLIVGNGADSTFGGLDKLLSRDWGFDAFVERYTFIEPADILNNPVDVRSIYTPYRRGDQIDYIGFLKVVHGIGITQAFLNGLETAGCKMVEPYERLALTEPLDLARIRSGESKYILRQVFKDLYPSLQPPEKVPFARPMDCWLGDWTGPKRREFRSDVDVATLTGDQKWLLFCLENFLNLVQDS